jgi:hypothetical protein
MAMPFPQALLSVTPSPKPTLVFTKTSATPAAVHTSAAYLFQSDDCHRCNNRRPTNRLNPHRCNNRRPTNRLNPLFSMLLRCW